MSARIGSRRPPRPRGALALAVAAAACACAAAAHAWPVLHDGPAGGEDIAHALARDAAGHVYVAGSTMSALGTRDVLVLKFSPAGTLLWQAILDPSGGGDDVALALAVDGSGAPIVAGHTRAGVDTDILVQKLTPSGALAWQRTIAGDRLADDEAIGVGVDSTDRVYVCATIGSPRVLSVVTGDDYLFACFEADGAPAWQVAVDGGFGGADYPTAFAVTRGGESIATGCVTGPDGRTDVLTVRMRADGGVRWLRHHGGGAGLDDWGLAVAVDSVDVAYVTGFVGTGATSADALTVRYSPAGFVSWARTFDGPLGDHDSGHAVAIGGDGAVFVAGATRDSTGAFDGLVLRYDAAGTLGWSRVLAGSGGGHDEFGGVAPVPGGGAIAIGLVELAAGDPDMIAVRYGPTGAVLGQFHHAGGAGGLDMPAGLLVADPTRAFVAGMSAETASGDDVLVASFDPSAIVTVEPPPAPPALIALGTPAPHPMRGAGELTFDLPRPGSVALAIHDLAGRRVRALVDGETLPAGRHARRLDARGLPAGVYFVRLRVEDAAGPATRTRRLVVLP